MKHLLPFGYPELVVGRTDRWIVLARSKQPTLGSLVLAAAVHTASWKDVSQETYSDLAVAMPAIERTLYRLFRYDVINYLSLMMVDKCVHVHVVPRYATPRQFAGITCVDAAFPQPPRLDTILDLGEERLGMLCTLLRDAWVLESRPSLP